MLESDDWIRVVEAAPVQPHLGDNMIGTPNGFTTTLGALAVGATTIGNLGQYFGFEWPGITDVELTEATVRALGAMAGVRNTARCCTRTSTTAQRCNSPITART